MKLAIVCDDLIQKGGAEKIVEAFSDIFPDAPIYTTIASDEWLKKMESKNRIVRTSFLQKFPFSVKLNRFYAPFLLHILAIESFDLSEFDVVLSSSSRFAHFALTKPSTKHISYVHSPGRMFWEPFDYFEKESFGVFSFIKKVALGFLKLPLMYIRMKDYEASQKVDMFLTNSITSQKRIKKYYGRDSEIVYPFVNIEKLKFTESADKSAKRDFYLIITRLAAWKKVDIAVKAFNDLGIELRIIGDGPDLNRLKKMAKQNIKFLGYASDSEKIENIKNCRAVIVTQKEDFGIVPLESMACGKPVIAFGEGGATEIVIEDKTGEFFYEQRPESLINIINNFNPDKYITSDCIERARFFNKEKFELEIKRIINV